MKIAKFSSFVVSLAVFFMIAACGEDKTIYEDTTPATDTTDTTPTTPTTPGDATNGATLFSTKCQTCHSVSSMKNTTVTEIKSNAMTYGLTDSQLNDIQAYLATQ